MNRVKFGDVVKRININVDRFNTDRLYYIGKGATIEPNALTVEPQGRINATLGFKFHFGFNPGHILFMSRCFDQHKAATATFFGICSDSTYVVETKDESVLLQRYLQLEMQSGRFWRWCEEHKSGGVNYLINYSTLETYEFDLPPIKEQKVLAEKLWAAYEVKQSYLKMIEATDEMVKAQFVEMFKNSPVVKLGDYISTQSGGTPNTKKSEYYDGGNIPWLSSGEINQGYINRTDKFITQDGLNNSSAKWLPKDTVVIAMYGATSGKVGYINIPLTTNQAVCALLPCDSFDSHYLYYAVSAKYEWLISQCRGAAQPNISQNIIRSMKLALPSMEEQLKFSTIIDQANKSISELRKSIEAIDKVIKSLINENL